jgi:predicted alpha/beta superfamily hydrolase
MRRRIYKILLLSLIGIHYISPSLAGEPVQFEIHSLYTGDSYSITIRKPHGFDPTLAYPVIYFTDAQLNSGKSILALAEERTDKTVLIGIAHIGNHVMRRQRDFLPADAGGYQNETFGQASKFYLFLREELIPYVNSKIVRQRRKTFIGHSFGGLLALYLSLKDQQLFDAYYAISPSVWANHGELSKIEENYAGQNKEYHSILHVYAGSLEFFNRVLSSTSEYYQQVRRRKYHNLVISFDTIRMANHYTIVDKVLPLIFEKINRD